MTDIKTLKENFTNQIKTLDEQIKQLESECEKAREYKLKLLGGLETLALLSPPEEETEEAIAE
jgi:benzoyl-CoA reductase/2-hydroxyglutaryl-CoA dehydratase subunit BcrC/BadD/HgdB